MLQCLSANIYSYSFKVDYIAFIYIQGPLTVTVDGKTTVYGIVSGNGANGTYRELMNRNRKRSLYFRVATADAIKWINMFIKKYEK